LTELPRRRWSLQKPCFGKADENSGRHGREASRKGKAALTEAAIGWNRRADGMAFRSRTTRLTGPIAGFIAGRGFAGPEG